VLVEYNQGLKMAARSSIDCAGEIPDAEAYDHYDIVSRNEAVQSNKVLAQEHLQSVQPKPSSGTYSTSAGWTYSASFGRPFRVIRPTARPVLCPRTLQEACISRSRESMTAGEHGGEDDERVRG
jgi:hypothetical protein